jgi:glycerol-3-phosphate acyltransferase PlsX
MTMPLKISVDAMGGDFGPTVVVPAVFESLKAHSDVHFSLFGNKTLIQAEIDKYGAKTFQNSIELFHCNSVIDGNDKPSSVIRNKADSSMAMAVRALTEGHADVCVSAGNTGALMALGLYLLGVLPGVYRPAICSAIPTQHGSCLVLDLGANTDCSAKQLLQFAQLGSVAAECLFSTTSPTVKLLNIGTESIKGNQVIQQSAELFKRQDNLNYQGFVEGDGLFAGHADVVVCDGFSGNIALKSCEGTAKLISNKFSLFLKQNWRTKLASSLLGNYLSDLNLSLRPEFYNGAYLLGLNGVVVKSHGGTDVLGFSAALNMAIESAQHQLLSKLSSKLK